MKTTQNCLDNDIRDNEIRGVELLVYQEKIKRTYTINRTIQHLLPLEAANINRTTLDKEHNEPTGEMRLRGQVAKISDFIRKL